MYEYKSTTMRSIVILVIFGAILHKGTALQCYQCIGSITSDCSYGVASSMVPLECDYVQRSLATPPLLQLLRGVREPQVVNVCISVTHNNFGVTAAERGCGWIYEDVDICDYMVNVQNLNLDACTSCSTARCNTDPLVLNN